VVEVSELLLESLSLLLLLDADNREGPLAPPVPTASTDLLLSSVKQKQEDIIISANFSPF